jgi:hypothetical protein
MPTKTYATAALGNPDPAKPKTYESRSATQEAFDTLGISSMLSLGNIPQSLQSFTTAGMLFNYDNILDFMRLIFVKPDISETITASYEEIKTLGRTIPQFGYVNTSGRKIDLEIHFMADVMPVVQVQRKLNWLKTFLYPRDEGGVARPPNKIIMCMGMYVMIKGVVTKVTVEHRGPFAGLTTGIGFLPIVSQYAVAKVSISETEHFWTGGQMTYERAMEDMNFAMAGSGQSTAVSTALNLL